MTRPTPAMYAAMQSAALGDDVLGDDPTVAELEAESSRITGHEAAVFVPSGTMGNQIALACHTHPGDCVLFDEDAHMLYYELGAPAVVAGVVTKTCPSQNGVMEPSDIRRRLQVGSLHTPATTALCVENTHNRAGGAVIPLDVMREYRSIADEHGMKLHLDGARVFNAATWLGVSVREITERFDSVTFCLSKALGSPVGSVLTGSAEFVHRARRWRKRLGGGMRQSGLLAACGLVSLREMASRLADDHRRAATLAEGIRAHRGLSAIHFTNFVMLDLAVDAARFVEELAAEGVRALAFGPQRIRFVTHYDVTDEGVNYALEAIGRVASRMRS